MIVTRILRSFRALFRPPDARGIDGKRPRDAYLDVLKDIQSPVRRVPSTVKKNND